MNPLNPNSRGRIQGLGFTGFKLGFRGFKLGFRLSWIPIYTTMGGGAIPDPPCRRLGIWPLRSAKSRTKNKNAGGRASRAIRPGQIKQAH